MRERGQPRLLSTKTAVLYAVALTGLQVFLEVRAFFHQPHHYGSTWLPLPLLVGFPGAEMVWNIFVESFIIYVAARFLADSVGLERVVVAGCASGIFLPQIQSLVPLLRGPLMYLRVVGALVGFIAALVLLAEARRIEARYPYRRRCNGRSNAISSVKTP